MKINKLECVNFRNLSDICFLPNENINIIYGENAQGKTNLIEAIWLFTGAKSFRGNKDKELVNFTKEKAKLKLYFESENVEKEAEILIGLKRTAIFNNNKLSSPSLLAGKLKAIIFSPDDLLLVSGSPLLRRKFLDTAIFQIYPEYTEIMKNYVRAVSQRNYILKQIKKSGVFNSNIEDFEREIVFYGVKGLNYRKKYLELLRPFFKEKYDGISSKKETAEIEYVSTFNEENFETLLKEKRNEDISLCATSVGLHRDDLNFILQNKSAKSFSSQGQKRSIALSLKLSEAEVINKIYGEYPIALLDDVMSELDSERQSYLLKEIKSRQVFITCCDKNNIINESSSVFKMEKGNLI